MASTAAQGELDAAESLHAHRVVLLALATLAELRESDTESHILRIQNYVRALADRLQTRTAYAALLSPNYIETLVSSVPMYDMGTVGVPDKILLKPGRLSPEEVAIMRTHTTQGYEAIVRAEKTLGRASPYLVVAKELTLSHQEKWNGKGYPQGLAGDAIPLSARIVALADVYDALSSQRCYKEPWPMEDVVQFLSHLGGSQFDPTLVSLFMDNVPQFTELRYALK